MKPHAEMVHWWFATGFLGLGIVQLARVVVGDEVWNLRPWRRYLWPSLLFTMGVLMWPVMTFFTNSAIHMLAHGIWAQALTLAGAAELGLARGKLRSPYWHLTSALGLAVSGVALLVHEQQYWLFSRAAFLHHALGWTAIAGAVFPLAAVAAAAFIRRCDGLCGDAARPRRPSVLRPRHGRDLRAPVAVRRSSAPMKRALLAVCVAALAVPAAASAHATLRNETPSFGTRVSSSPTTLYLRFDQVVDVFPDGVRVLNVRGVNFAGPRTCGRARDHRAVEAGGPRRLHGSLARALARRARRLRRLHVRRPRAGAERDRGSVGAGGPTTTEHVVRWLWILAIALLVGGLGFRLLVVRGPLPARAERRFFWVTGIGAVGVLEIAIVAFLLRCEDVLQLPFGGFLYGDLSPIADGTRIGQAFVVMELGFALVAAILVLAWLTDRRVLLWPAFLLGLGFASGLSLSGHSAADAGSSGSPSSRTGCTFLPRRSGSAASCSSSPSCGRPRRSCAGRRSSASRGSRPSASRCSLPPARISASQGCRNSTTCGGRGTGTCCS